MHGLMLLQMNDAVNAARTHQASLMVEDIVRKSNERNSENMDRVLKGTNRSS